MRRRAVSLRLAAVAAAVGGVLLAPATADAADRYQLIEGTGSTWSQNAINQWIADVSSVGIQVAYGGGGSSKGRRDFGEGTVDFAVTEIPFQGRDPRTGASDTPNGRDFAYMPVVAGGTSFMYHLEVGGQLYRGLRLSGETVSKIFTGQITSWDDPAITKDNNGYKLPATPITPVIRSDGSGTSAQFTAWMDNQYPSLWRPFCGCSGLTSYYPIKNGFVAKDGSVGVAGYVSASYGNGSIGYVEYSYALNDNYPVAKVLNKAGYYVEPTAYNVAVALTRAKINQDRGSQLYLTQILDGVYNYDDPRTYPLSSYSYMIIPTGKDDPRMNEPKARTLGDFAYYFLCEGQQEAAPLGYSPLPLNLVKAGFAQVRRIPGADTSGKDPTTCNNPTFDPHNPGKNVLAETAPLPPECDKVGEGPCGIAGPTPTTTTGPAGGSGGGQTTGAQGPGSGGITGPVQPGSSVGVPTLTGPTVGGVVTDAGTPVQYYGTAAEVDQYRTSGNNSTLRALIVAEILAFLLIPPLLLRLWRDRKAARR
jgi:phosphate transport system substrate-binding protein